MRRRLTPLLSREHPSVRRRLVALAVLGVGLPILFLAGLGILQTSQIARFVRATTIEYGHYAASLVANALNDEVWRRANDAAESARLAAGWGGASPQFLDLLETRDPLFRDPFLTPEEEIRARLEGVMLTDAAGALGDGPLLEPSTAPRPGAGAAIPGAAIAGTSTADSFATLPREGPGGAFGVLPEGASPRPRPTVRTTVGPPDSVLVTVPVARSASSTLDARIKFPAWFWRQLLNSTGDTTLVLPRNALGPDSPAFVVFPIIGFPQRVVAVAGWRFDPDGLTLRQLEEIVEREVYRDQRVFRGDVMRNSTAILILTPTGREIFRSREVGTKDGMVKEEIGGILPGWSVVAAPAKGNAYVTIRRFIVGEYVLLVVLLALSLVALAVGLRLAVEQVEVAELKSGFLANVTHELKTPLAMIRMASETLELGRVRSEDDSRRFLGTISRECRRLTHMINNVLDFAKIEEGKREFFFAPTDLGRLISDTLEIFEPQLKQGDFALTVDVPSDLPPVEVDPQAVTQCLINLVDNAIKYSRDRRELSIQASVNGTPGHGTARVSVSDRGIGVAPRDAERIFEKFTRAETGLVHNVKGSGLGLALVRHIARAHGGDVELTSVPGEGSTFTLVLPVKQGERKEEEAWPRRS
ncbi:MAG: sensor histidine kinase [Candidatus Eiseniibacteriota bacterium]